MVRRCLTDSFQLEVNAAHLDKLTTWIEYLGLECFLEDEHRKDYNYWRQKRRASWDRLIDQHLLKPGETKDSVVDVDVQQEYMAVILSYTGPEEAILAVARKDLLIDFQEQTKYAEWAKRDADLQATLVRWVYREKTDVMV